ncbi:ABC transporter substrate-binding protein [Konateibacter massiliensis]|uniref:ABC transporter substrate-binding protein n=1 Tax=Konateibacter massiliensis TaxID=2002841 RepID=UPI000C15A31D|nr:ABC transporter substrate-binding protein [Konateibacter massiliensis]
MKKRKWYMIFALILCISMIAGCGGGKTSSGAAKDITLNEVAHSIFYAPQYVAIENGYFEDEGLNVTLVTGFGADKTMTAVLSGEADIGFMGSEASIYAYSEGATDYAVNFAQLTQRAGNFLISREQIENFDWSMIKGSTVLGGRKGGMPQMVFEYILKKNGIDPAADLTIVQNIDFGSTAAAFSGGQGDYSVEFEPSATALEQEGDGYVVASLGESSGYVPYTAYCAKTSYISENAETIQSFVNALQKGMDYVAEHSPEEIAKVIQPQFKETDLDTITAIVTRYYEQDTWKDNLVFEEDSFMLLQNILQEAGQLEEYAPYEALVDNTFSEKAK